jgi:hypothetical protein
MKRIVNLFHKRPIFVIVLGFLLIATFTVIFQYTLFTGFKVGTILGKVHSIERVPAGGGGWRVLRVDMANVITSSGENIKVYCLAYCRLDQELEIIIYKPLFGGNPNYVYERT